MIEVAINGIRSKGEHPGIPLMPDEIVQDVVTVAKEGAEAVHLHVRNAYGEETLEPAWVNHILTRLRSHVPQLPVGISTGEWIEPDLRKRLDTLRNWEVLPDFVSVNLHEEGFQEVVAIMLEKGIGLEAGVYDQKAAKALVESNFSKRCLQVLIEPQEQNLLAAQRTVISVMQVLAEGRITTPKLLHGFDATTWPLIEMASQKGFDTRIGLEDCLFLPGGEPAEDNAALLRVTRKLVNEMGKYGL
jgi:uncharacterized protein (DUF849 family)